MDEKPKLSPTPKKSCLITLMFPVTNDAEALTIKQVIDDAVMEMKEKRYSFQINET